MLYSGLQKLRLSCTLNISTMPFLHTCMVVLTGNSPNVSVKNLTFCRRITYFVAKSCWILILTNYTSIQATTIVILLMFYFNSENVVTFIPHQICLNFVCKYSVRDNRVISASRILSPAWQKCSVSYIYLLSIWLKSHVSFAPLLTDMSRRAKSEETPLLVTCEWP